MRRLFPIVLMAAVLGGCSAGKDTAASQQAVTQFHHQLDAGQYDAIYDGSGGELKALTSKPDFVALLDAIHRKLGAVKEAKQVAWNVNYNTGGGTISLTYQTQFASGSSTEEFVYRTGQPPALIGYHIQSNDLMTK